MNFSDDRIFDFDETFRTLPLSLIMKIKFIFLYFVFVVIWLVPHIGSFLTGTSFPIEFLTILTACLALISLVTLILHHFKTFLQLFQDLFYSVF